MKQKDTEAEIFKDPDRLSRGLNNPSNLFSYLFRDILRVKNINAGKFMSLLSRYERDMNLGDKPGSSVKGNTKARLLVREMTLTMYIRALKLLRCKRTSITIEHEWEDGTKTYHQKVWNHRLSKDPDENKED